MTYVPGLFPLVQELSSPATSMVFDVTNMPPGMLIFDALLRTDDVDGIDGIQLTFNGDSGANYSNVIHRHFDDGSSSGTGGDGAGASAFGLFISAGASPTNGFSGFRLIVPRYKDSSTFKSALMFSNLNLSDAAAGDQQQCWDQGLWMNTNAITTVTFSESVNQFVSGSRISAYVLV